MRDGVFFSRDHFKLPIAASREAWFVATIRTGATARQRDMAVLCWDTEVIERMLHNQNELLALLCLCPLGGEWPQWGALAVRAVWRHCHDGRGLVVEDEAGRHFEIVPGGLETVADRDRQSLTLLANLDGPVSGAALQRRPGCFVSTAMEFTLKMYILVRDDVPMGVAMVAVAHASLAAYLKFKDEPHVQQWLSGPFFKVVCKVNQQEFERAKSVEDHVVITESALGNQEVAIAFAPRQEWPKMFRFLSLYRDPP
jgi:hypothetical protein